MRCLAISDAIQSTSKYKTYFYIDTEYDLHFIKNYESLDWINNYKTIIKQLKKYNFVIIDSINITRKTFKEIEKFAKNLCFIDDYFRWNHQSGLIIDWTILSEKNKKYNTFDNLKYLNGTKYAALRSEFWKPKKKLVRKKIHDVLITFGGSDNNNLTPNIIKIFRKNFNDITMNIVIGKGYKNTTEIKKLIDKKTKLIIHPGASKMREAMFNSDVAIASGGQTLYELACMGLPTIAIIMIDNQVEDTLGFQKTGFLLNAGWWNHKLFEKKFINLFNSMLSYSSRKKMSIIGQKNVDGQGAVRIAKNIVKKIR